MKFKEVINEGKTDPLIKELQSKFAKSGLDGGISYGQLSVPIKGRTIEQVKKTAENVSKSLGFKWEKSGDSLRSGNIQIGFYEKKSKIFITVEKN